MHSQWRTTARTNLRQQTISSRRRPGPSDSICHGSSSNLQLYPLQALLQPSESSRNPATLEHRSPVGRRAGKIISSCRSRGIYLKVFQTQALLNAAELSHNPDPLRFKLQCPPAVSSMGRSTGLAANRRVTMVLPMFQAQINNCAKQQ